MPTLPIAGFCSSGILGIEGIWTKLKYHNSPIHITPLSTCSQRHINAIQALSPGMPSPVAPMTITTMTTVKTKPAITVDLRLLRMPARNHSSFFKSTFNPRAPGERIKAP